MERQPGLHEAAPWLRGKRVEGHAVSRVGRNPHVEEAFTRGNVAAWELRFGRLQLWGNGSLKRETSPEAAAAWA